MTIETTHVISSLTDIPGIGATKAKWLAEAGFGTPDAVRAASVEAIAHVRGIGYDLATRIKQAFEPIDDAAPAATNGAAEAEALVVWQTHLGEALSEIDREIAVLLADPAARALKLKFVRQIEKLRDTMASLVLVEVPGDAKVRRRMTKQVDGLRGLIGSALKMGDGSANHQKAVRNSIRARRKKLAKLI